MSVRRRVYPGPHRGYWGPKQRQWRCLLLGEKQGMMLLAKMWLNQPLTWVPRPQTLRREVGLNESVLEKFLQ